MKTFTCALCGWTGPKAWSDLEAAAECVELFGDLPLPEDRVQVCDPCHKRMIAEYPPDEWKRRHGR
jgi:hypothetical protein